MWTQRQAFKTLILDVKKQLDTTCKERLLSLFCSLILGSEKKCDKVVSSSTLWGWFLFSWFQVCNFLGRFVELSQQR